MNTCRKGGGRTGQKEKLRQSQCRGLSWLYEKVWSWNDPSGLPEVGRAVMYIRRPPQRGVLLGKAALLTKAIYLQVILSAAGRVISEGRPGWCLTGSTIGAHPGFEAGVADVSHCLWMCFNHGWNGCSCWKCFLLYTEPKIASSSSSKYLYSFWLWPRKTKWALNDLKRAIISHFKSSLDWPHLISSTVFLAYAFLAPHSSSFSLHVTCFKFAKLNMQHLKWVQ